MFSRQWASLPRLLQLVTLFLAAIFLLSYLSDIPSLQTTAEMSQKYSTPATRWQVESQNIKKRNLFTTKKHKKSKLSKYQVIKFEAGIKTAKYIVKKEYKNVSMDLKYKPGLNMIPAEVRRILILSNFRSGSTFLGQILDSYPGVFHTFEPLHQMLGDMYFQGGAFGGEVFALLRRILTCSLGARDDKHFLRHLKTTLEGHGFIKYNTRYWKACGLDKSLCFNANFFNQVCAAMPVHVVKTVRLGTESLPELLMDLPDLRVLHLVRDPRGSFASRRKLAWCNFADCNDTATVCNHLQRDLRMAQLLRKEFPDRYRLVRYEDIATSPKETLRPLLRFAGLDPTASSVDHFLDSHTQHQKKKTNAYSTYKESSDVAFSWRKSSEFSVVEKIQSACREPFKMMNLRVFDSEDDYRNASLSVML